MKPEPAVELIFTRGARSHLFLRVTPKSTALQIKQALHDLPTTSVHDKVPLPMQQLLLFMGQLVDDEVILADLLREQQAIAQPCKPALPPRCTPCIRSTSHMHRSQLRLDHTSWLVSGV
jgi:hypothetical protein